MIFTLTSIVNDPDIEAVMALLKRLLILQVESAKDLPAATSSSLLTSWRDYIDELGELIDPWHMRQLIDFVLYPQEVTSQVLENSDFIAAPPHVETFISNFLLLLHLLSPNLGTATTPESRQRFCRRMIWTRSCV